MPQIFTAKSRFEVVRYDDAICFCWNEWMKIDRFFFNTNHVQWVQNQLLQLIGKSWHKPINKMDLQRDKNWSYWKEKKATSLMTNSLQTTKPNTYFSRRK